MLSPIVYQINGIQEGDVVTAINGRSIESWAGNVLEPHSWGSNWETGEEVIYTISRSGEKRDLSIALGEFPIEAILSTYWGPIVFALISQIVATITGIYRPEERGAQVLFIWAWSGSHTYAWSLGLQISDLTNGFGFWLYNLFTPILWLLYWSAGLHFALIFPQKHPLTQRFPKFIPGIYVAAYTSFFTYLILNWWASSSHLEWLGKWRTIPDLVPPIYLASTVFIVLWGYFRVYDPISRRKIRWLVYGASVSGGGGLILYILPPFLTGQPMISFNTLGLLTIPFPITLAIAILRHRLFDIDLVINRTLVYGLLTGSLVLLYFSSVVLLQTFFRTLTGETSQIAIVASTLGIASIFNPLRRRVQSFIDRRFYRDKHDAQETLASFSKTLRQEVDLETLQSRLVAVVQETMHPEHMSIWLRETEREAMQIINPKV